MTKITTGFKYYIIDFDNSEQSFFNEGLYFVEYVTFGTSGTIKLMIMIL